MHRRILVTGAGGFLGRHFVKKYLSEGDTVHCIDDFSAAHAVETDGALWLPHMDISQGLRLISDKAWKHHGQYDVAIHLASPVGGRMKIDKDPFFNMDAFRQDSEFFRWAAVAKPKMVIYPSSSAVYPVRYQTHALSRRLDVSMVDVTKEGLTEGTPDATYGFTKLAGEHMAYTLSKTGVKVLVMRPFSGYGPGQPEDYPMTAIIKRAIRKEDPLVVWGDGKQVRDFVYVDDIVSIGDTYLPGDFNVMNIGTGIGTSFIRLARMVADMSGYKPEIATLIDRPVGVQHRVAVGPHRAMVPLHEGLKKTMQYYESVTG